MNDTPQHRTDAGQDAPGTTIFYHGGRGYLLAALMGVPFSIIALGLILRVEGFGDLDPPWAPRLIGAGILALMAFISWHAGLYPRRPQITVGPEGLHVHERHAKPIPWHAIRRAILFFDASPTGLHGAQLGWVLQAQIDDADQWMTETEVRQLAEGGTLAIGVGTLAAHEIAGPPERALLQAIGAYTPITRHEP